MLFHEAVSYLVMDLAASGAACPRQLQAPARAAMQNGWEEGRRGTTTTLRDHELLLLEQHLLAAHGATAAAPFLVIVVGLAASLHVHFVAVVGLHRIDVGDGMHLHTIVPM